MTLKKDVFIEELGQADEKISLARVSLLFAQKEAYADLDVVAYMERIKGFAREIEKRLGYIADGNSVNIYETVEVVNSYLFEELGFHGNSQDYYDPCNSFLNEVLDQRKGIPITLSILYMEVLAALCLETVGINFPGHFLLKVKGPERKELVVDAFNKGAVLTCDYLQGLLDRTYKGEKIILSKDHMKEASKHQVLLWLLENIKNIYIRKEDFLGALRVMESMLVIDPKSTPVYRDRGMIHQLMREYEKAVQDFSEYVRLDPKAGDAAAIEIQIDLLKRAVCDFN